jgi:hypothetical protein
MIISTAGNTPGSLGDLVCAATSFDDVESKLLPALADDLDADSVRRRIAVGGVLRRRR